MRLLRSELQLRNRATLGWAAGVVLLAAMIAGFYPAVKHLPGLDSLYANLPAALQGLLGGSDLVSSSGYLRTQLFAFFLPVVLLVLGMGRGAAALAGEEEEHTLDLLLAQPISRASLYVQKSVALAVWLAVMVIATWAPLAALDSLTKLDAGIVGLLAACVQMGLLCLTASLACQAVAAAAGRRVVGIAAVGYYLFLSYLIYGLSGAVHWLRPARPLTLWRWYLGGDPLNRGFDMTAVIVLAALCVVAVAAGAWGFQRRNLHA